MCQFQTLISRDYAASTASPLMSAGKCLTTDGKHLTSRRLKKPACVLVAPLATAVRFAGGEPEWKNE